MIWVWDGEFLGFNCGMVKELLVFIVFDMKFGEFILCWVGLVKCCSLCECIL